MVAISRLVPLLLPVVAGLEPTTLIRYAVPAVLPAGICALMLPEVVELSVPIFTGLAKLPVEEDNCAVKVFPALKIPVTVYGTEIFSPEQNGLPLTVPVLIVGADD